MNYQDPTPSDYIAQAKLEEQRRIIKLLETYMGITGMFGLERDDLIALIKGENK